MKLRKANRISRPWDTPGHPPRGASEANGGFHESTLELKQGLDVRETPLGQLPVDLLRQLLQRRAEA